jgi:Tfp pilus assembly major pilin PilA
MRRIKKYFTLMELLIVMAIIIMVTTVIGFNVTKAIENDRFRTGTNLMLNRLKMAQDLMLILKTDVTLKCVQNKEKKEVSCYIQVEKPLTQALEKIINANPLLNGISHITFNDKEMNRDYHDNFTLNFVSGGSKMSRGFLRLNNGNLEELIYLPGYPNPIGSHSKVFKGHIEARQHDNQNDELYPREIKKIFEEI